MKINTFSAAMAFAMAAEFWGRQFINLVAIVGMFYL